MTYSTNQFNQLIKQLRCKYGWQDILHCMTCVMTYDILYDMGTREMTQVVSNFNLETKDVKKGPFLVIMSCKMV